MQVQAKIHREIKLRTGEYTSAETTVRHIIHIALQIRIIHTSIHINTEQRNRVPICVYEQARRLFLSYITISSLENTRVLRIDKGILLDRIIHERISSARVNAEFLGEHTIVQVNIITFLRVQIRVAEGYILRIRIVYIRIQIPDTRTLDTHIISQTDLLRLSDRVRQRNVRYDIHKIRMKVFLSLIHI